MELIVNGEAVQLSVETLEELVAYYGLESKLVVTEVDGEIIDRSSWKERKLTSGEKIELVHFVGGG